MEILIDDNTYNTARHSDDQRAIIAKLIRYDEQARQQCKCDISHKHKGGPAKTPRAATEVVYCKGRDH